MIFENVVHLTAAVKRLPPLERFRKYRYRRFFAGNCYGCFFGAFGSFAEARAAAPRAKYLGFDHPDYPSHHLDRLDKVEAHDYPAMLWLRSALQPGVRVFDLGGNVGVSYYAYRRYLDYPPGLRWVVSELPDMSRAGREIAASRGASSLEFSSDSVAADGADVFFASGVLQYIEAPSLAQMLSRLEHKPPHVILNKLPLHEGPQCVTLQNNGFMNNPQYVFNRHEFVHSLERLSYRLVDSWDVHGYSCFVPFHQNIQIPSYRGLYFRRTEPIK